MPFAEVSYPRETNLGGMSTIDRQSDQTAPSCGISGQIRIPNMLIPSNHLVSSVDKGQNRSGQPTEAYRPASSKPHRRRGCQHCITCSGIQHHCHSTTVRSSASSAAEWWPGGIHSPVVYYHLRSRQLRYAQRFPQRSSSEYRSVSEVHTSPSALLQRRGRESMSVLVPLTYTNINQSDAPVIRIGERTIALKHQNQPALMMAKRPFIVAPHVPPHTRATWSHPDEFMIIDDQQYRIDDHNHQQRQSTTIHSNPADGINVADQSSPKRRCTSEEQGHFIAIAPAKSVAYPGVVKKHQSPSFPLSVHTPPMLRKAPMSASSETSMASTGSSSTWNHTLSLTADTSGVMDMTPSQVPLLIANGNAPIEGDPTLRQYYERQYNIKQEQAFPCHQVVEIDDDGVKIEGNRRQSSGWAASLLRTFTETLLGSG